MPIVLNQYYDRFDPAQNYERHLFRAGNVLQSAELNELQSASLYRLQQVTDALLKEGDVLSGADIVVDAITGDCTCAAGAIYLRGAVRGVPPGDLTIPVSGVVNVGVYLNDSVVTELTDPTLRDPAISVRNYQEPGAARYLVDPTWGYAGDLQDGDFFPVYQVEDGLLLSKAPPPQVDATAAAIARYDRQSAGGYYISTGMNVSRLADANGHQVFSMADGVARVGGEEIIRQHARRHEYAAVPDTLTVSLEPHVAAGGTERVDTSFFPIHSIASIAITKVETVSVTHGAATGALDLLPHSPVVQIILVQQGATTYDAGVDYQLTADKVDWSLAGDEPAPGSTYDVTYHYIAIVSPESPDETGFSVTGAVATTYIQVTYDWALPRFDLICLNRDGDIVTVKGVSARFRPRVPNAPPGLLSVAVIDQRWGAATQVLNNGVRMIPMDELNNVNTRIDTLFALVAEERLALNLTQKDSTAKKGVFTDPFLDDDLRDQGLVQTAAIFEGELTLGVTSVVHSQALDEVFTLDARVLVELDETVGPAELVISQTLRTSYKKINPYDAYSPLPGVAILSPSVDFWTEFDTNWLSPITRQFDETVSTDRNVGNFLFPRLAALVIFVAGRLFNWRPLVVQANSLTRTEVEKVGTRYVDLQYLRQIPVRFELSGFGPNEEIQSVTFDGRTVAFAEV